MNSEMIWKKIVKWYGKYGRKPSWIVNKIGKIWKKSKRNSEKDMKIMEETQVE